MEDQQAGQPVQDHVDQVAEPRSLPYKFVFHGKHHEGQWAITATGHQSGFPFRVKKAEERIFGKKSRNSLDALLCKGVIRYNNGIVLSVIVSERICVEQTCQREDRPTPFVVV